MSTQPPFKTLLDLVKSVNKFEPKGDEWMFRLPTLSNEGKAAWRSLGIVLSGNVKWLKKAKSLYLKFHDESKEIRLDPPPKADGTFDLNNAWHEIHEKLGLVVASQGEELPTWASLNRDLRHIYGSKESWPLLGAPKGYETGIWCDLVPIFGVATSGAHLNVYTKTEHGIEVWVSLRGKKHANFPNTFDQAVAGGFVPTEHENIKDCVSQESKQEAKGLPDDSNARMTEHPCIQYFDVRDDRWERGYTSLPEPGIRKVYDLKVANEEVQANEDQQQMTRMTLPQIVESLLQGKWKPNCALVMIDFMIRHGAMPNATVSGDVAQIRRLMELKTRFHPDLDIPTVDLVNVKHRIRRST